MAKKATRKTPKRLATGARVQGPQPSDKNRIQMKFKHKTIYRSQIQAKCTVAEFEIYWEMLLVWGSELVTSEQSISS